MDPRVAALMGEIKELLQTSAANIHRLEQLASSYKVNSHPERLKWDEIRSSADSMQPSLTSKAKASIHVDVYATAIRWANNAKREVETAKAEAEVKQEKVNVYLKSIEEDCNYKKELQDKVGRLESELKEGKGRAK